MKNSTIIPRDETLALDAADVALQERLAMEDVTIIATARLNNCKAIASDIGLKHQSCVTYIPKTYAVSNHLLFRVYPIS